MLFVFEITKNHIKKQIRKQSKKNDLEYKYDKKTRTIKIIYPQPMRSIDVPIRINV